MKASFSILRKDVSSSLFLSIPIWVWITLLPVFIIRVYIAWAPVNQSFALSVPDDAYYYFTIAQNIALGKGVTFDGLTPTNGFHPFWMMLITPLWWITGHQNKELPVHLALTLGAILDVVTTVGIWTLANSLIPRRLIGALIVLAYAWNPYNVAASVNGLETSVGAMCFVWSLVAWWRIRLVSRPTRRDWFALGLLWSILLMARTDYALIMIPCGLDLAWRFRTFWRSAWPITVGVVVWLPWLSWNFVTFKSFSQVSGEAYPYYLHALWQANSHSMEEWLAHEARLGYGIAANLARLSGFDKGILLLAVAIGWLVSEAIRDSRRATNTLLDRWSLLSGLVWPTVGSIALLLFHSLVRWIYVPWYFVPASILLVLWFGVLLNRLAQKNIAWALILGSLYLAFQISHGAYVLDHGGMWAEQGQAIERQWPQYLALCERYNTIGISDSGYAGYYLPCRVVNLDGVVNNEAFTAIVQGEFRQYLDRTQIDYVVLNEIVQNVVEKREGPIPTIAPFTSN